MTAEKYSEIIKKVNDLAKNNAIKEYLEKVIEEVDNDNNGYNDQIITLYNSLKEIIVVSTIKG